MPKPDSPKKISEQKSAYKGDFSKSGFRNGKGVSFYQDNTVEYDGEWLNGKKNGYGTYYL